MELVKENNKRLAILISIVLAFVYMFLLLISKVSLLVSTLFIVIMIAFFTLITYARKKTYLIYFSTTGIKFKIDKKETHIKWNDLKIDLKQDYIKYLYSIGYNLTSIENNKSSLVLSICWENEKSIIELTKKYVPENHDLYIAVSEYSKKRGLEF
jgi:hypothetical protein